LKTHPAADVVRVTEAFIAAADGSHDKSKREPGVALTRYDRRMLNTFVEDGHGLPTGALTIEKHVGYRFCGFAGAEPPEILAFYAEIKGHAGTWSSHEQRVKDRCEGLIFHARRMGDDVGEVIDGIEAGDAAKEPGRSRLERLLEGVHSRAETERDLADQAATALRGFATDIHDSLAARVVEKLELISDTAFNTDNFMLRAKMRRLLKEIGEHERAYARLVDADEWNLLGRRFERSLYSATTVEAHEALEAIIYEYKTVVGQVAIPHRLQKSLGMRRVTLGNAALSARSAAQGLGHLATVWATIAGALGEQLAAFQAGKDAKALKPVGDQLEVLVGLWKKLETLAAVNDDTLG
jgi:hypothetical protein